MVQVTNFLLRWLFLCRLVDDRAEVQTWPYRRPGYYEHCHGGQQNQVVQTVQNQQQPLRQNQQNQPHQQYHQQQEQQQQHEHYSPKHSQHSSYTPKGTRPQSQQQTNTQQTHRFNLIHEDHFDLPSYRESIIRLLTSHPPGSTERLQQLDELRLNAVRELAEKLFWADDVIRCSSSMELNDGANYIDSDGGGNNVGDRSSIDCTRDSNIPGDASADDVGVEDLDVDISIQAEYRNFIQTQHELQEMEELDHFQKRWNFLHGSVSQTRDFNANTNPDEKYNDHTVETIINQSKPQRLQPIPLHGLTPPQISQTITYAQNLLFETRTFLPQLVSTVLHSPPPLLPNHHPHHHLHQIDPISTLRSLLLQRSCTDPSLGIQLCWLLEAEVGRNWKALFEHRQQTGKRLILIVQSDIARVIASIGAEKASAFNLLQDAEMRTAFGREREKGVGVGVGGVTEDEFGMGNLNRNGGYTVGVTGSSMGGAASATRKHHSRPPRSLSDLRCRHFGDSMHLVDRLTQISLDLRHVSPLHRKRHLQERLNELNKRLFRRMVTKGRVSIDVDSLLDDEIIIGGGNGMDETEGVVVGMDGMMEFPHHPHHCQHYSQHSQQAHFQQYGQGHPQYPGSHAAAASPWSEENVQDDMIHHSVHFPMEPECVRWPGEWMTEMKEKVNEQITSGEASSPTTQTKVPTSSTMPKALTAAVSDFEHPLKQNGVVRALRILPDQCRVLASRERCPFLVRMEVVETGLGANDARLYAGDETGVGDAGGGGGYGVGGYASVGHGSHGMGRFGGGNSRRESGVGGVGLTIEETLGGAKTTGNCGFPLIDIPPELLRDERGSNLYSVHSQEEMDHSGRDQNDHFHPHVAKGIGSSSTSTSSTASQAPFTTKSTSPTSTTSSPTKTSSTPAVLSRGGYQPGEEGYYFPPDVYGDYNTYEMVREQQYEQLHHDLRQQRENEFHTMGNGNLPLSASGFGSQQQVTKGLNLLNRVYGPPWQQETTTLRSQSPFGHLPYWRLASFIIKAGEDIRKEALVMQVMSKLWTWFQDEIPPKQRPYLRPYTIMCVGGDAGVVECLSDVKSVNEVKKETDGFTTLLNFFERAYGSGGGGGGQPLQQHPQQIVTLEKARDNFLRSLVGYSVVCYILQIKDRHNANILLDREGHIMHIDFGFVLGETPKMGKVPLFSERAPFKLSAEFWEVIGGWSSFKRFCEMFEAAYTVAASHADEICSLVEAAIVNVSRDAELARSLADGVRGRLRVMKTGKEQKMHIMNIVNDAITSWGTSTYDWLQRSMNGYQ